jgi:hypothetical protein
VITVALIWAITVDVIVAGLALWMLWMEKH